MTATTAANPRNRRARTAPRRRLAEVVLGDLQVVAANRFDRAVAAGPVGQLHPDGLASPGQLTKRERELVPAGGRWRRRPERRRFGRRAIETAAS